MRNIVFTTICLLAGNYAFAANDLPPSMCDHKGLIQCLKISSRECEQSMSQMIEMCVSHIDMNNDTHEAGEITKNIAPCLSLQFLNQTGLTQTRLETCDQEFEDFYLATLRWIEKKKQEYDDKFFNEDDPLHNYYENTPNNAPKSALRAGPR